MHHIVVDYSFYLYLVHFNLACRYQRLLEAYLFTLHCTDRKNVIFILFWNPKFHMNEICQVSKQSSVHGISIITINDKNKVIERLKQNKITFFPLLSSLNKIFKNGMRTCFWKFEKNICWLEMYWIHQIFILNCIMKIICRSLHY